MYVVVLTEKGMLLRAAEDPSPVRYTVSEAVYQDLWQHWTVNTARMDHL